MSDVKRAAIFMGIVGGGMYLLGFITGHVTGFINHDWLNGYSKGYSKGVEDESKKREKEDK